MAGRFFWLKERVNPQLGTYYVKCGKITAREAKTMENSLYGDNYMHKFKTIDEYESKISELKDKGFFIQ